MPSDANERMKRSQWSIPVWSFGIATICAVATYLMAATLKPTYSASASIELSQIAEIDRFLPTIVALQQQADIKRPDAAVSQIIAGVVISASGPTAAEASAKVVAVWQEISAPPVAAISEKLDQLQAEADLMSAIVSETQPQLRSSPELLPAYASARFLLETAENDKLRAEMAVVALSRSPAPTARLEGDSPIALAIAAWAAVLAGSAIIISVVLRVFSRR